MKIRTTRRQRSVKIEMNNLQPGTEKNQPEASIDNHTDAVYNYMEVDNPSPCNSKHTGNDQYDHVTVNGTNTFDHHRNTHNKDDVKGEIIYDNGQPADNEYDDFCKHGEGSYHGNIDPNTYDTMANIQTNQNEVYGHVIQSNVEQYSVENTGDYDTMIDLAH